MSWLIFVVVTVFFDSLRIYIDNYVSDYYFKGRGAASQKLFYGIAFTLFGAISLAISHTDIAAMSFSTVLQFIIAGLLSSFAGIFYYKALEKDNSTNLGIFIQTAPIFYLILGWLLLGETITLTQLAAFAIILFASFLIVFTARKRSRKIRIMAAFYAFLYVLISVFGNLIYVKESAGAESFFSEMSLVFIGLGIGNLLIIALMPKWRRRFLAVYRSSHRLVLRPLFGGLVVSLVKKFSYHATLILAPSVALASATSDSAEPIAIFFMGIVLTLIWPKFGREKIDRKSILVHLIAIILVVIGVVLIQQ